MKTVALISGGKDSCYNMMQCVKEGHQIVALANLKPKDKDEEDSYMFQTVGHHAVSLYAEAMELPLYRRTLEGKSVEIGRDYDVNSMDEVEDLFSLLKQVKDEMNVEAVSVGAILSDYQRVRVENVCGRLNLTVLAYLWQRDQTELLDEMIKCDVEAIIIKVAALGLEPSKHLGLELESIQSHMGEMKDKYGLNVCGEGGEYETFTLDCPLFNKSIVIDSKEVVVHSDDAFAPVAYLNLTEMHLEDKDYLIPLPERLEHLPMMNSKCIKEDLGFTGSINDLDTENSAQLEESLVKEEDSSDPQITAQLDSDYICVYKDVSGLFSLCGVCGFGEEGCDVETVSSEAMKSLAYALSSHGLMVQDLMSVCLYVRRMEDFSCINNSYRSMFNINPPVRVCVQANLPCNVLLQLDALGYNNQSGISRLPMRQTMHIQSLSHWAPANIGPYSQACQLGDVVFVSGQIGMVPANLKIIEGSVLHESRLSLRHVSRVLSAMSPGTGFNNIISAICYVTHASHISKAMEEWHRAFYNATQTQQEVAKRLLTFVVVPALPKGANVEWQVVAGISGQIKHGELVYSHEHFPSMSHYIVSVGQPNWCSLTVRLDRIGNETVDAGEVVGALLGTMWQMWQRACHDVAVLGCTEASPASLPTLPLRVFYLQHLLQTSSLVAAYEECKSAVLGLNAPPATFIPVEAFQLKQTIVTLCM